MRRALSLNRLLLETDSPYMGLGADYKECSDFERDNEPCTLPVLAEVVAKLYGVDVEEVARQTTMNAQRFYRRDFGVPADSPARVVSADLGPTYGAKGAQGKGRAAQVVVLEATPSTASSSGYNALADDFPTLAPTVKKGPRARAEADAVPTLLSQPAAPADNQKTAPGPTPEPLAGDTADVPKGRGRARRWQRLP